MMRHDRSDGSKGEVSGIAGRAFSAFLKISQTNLFGKG